MENTTSIDKFLAYHEKDKEISEIKQKSRIYKLQEKHLEKKCKTLLESQKRMNPEELLELEAFIVTNENETEENSKELKANTAKALTQCAEARTCLETVQSYPEYLKANSTYGQRTRDKANLPTDSCRQFIRSQITRLGNKLTMHDLSKGEIKYLNLRRDNMYCLEKLYIEMQKQALGLSTDKKKGLSL